MSVLLTTNELAAKLNVHRITVLRMANKGTIPYMAIGKTEQRYDWDKVIAALEVNNTKGKG